MSDECGSDSIFTQLAVDNTAEPVFGSFTSADLAFQLLGGPNLDFQEELVNPETLNGRIVGDSEISVDGQKSWSGGWATLFTPDAIQEMMPKILGGAWAAGVSVPTIAAPPLHNLLVHKDAYLYPYVKGRISQASISGDQGNPVSMSMQYLGINRLALEAGSAWPVGLDVNLSVPYMFEDCVVRVNGTVVYCRKWAITRDNRLGFRFWGTRNPTCIKRDGRSVTTLSLTLPHNSTMVPLFTNHDPKVPKAVTLTFTHPTAGMSCTITFPSMQFPRKDPPVGGTEVLLETTGTARGLAGAVEISVANDNTPS